MRGGLARRRRRLRVQQSSWLLPRESGTPTKTSGSRSKRSSSAGDSSAAKLSNKVPSLVSARVRGNACHWCSAPHIARARARRSSLRADSRRRRGRASGVAFRDARSECVPDSGRVDLASFDNAMTTPNTRGAPASAPVALTSIQVDVTTRMGALNSRDADRAADPGSAAGRRAANGDDDGAHRRGRVRPDGVQPAARLHGGADTGGGDVHQRFARRDGGDGAARGASPAPREPRAENSLRRDLERSGLAGRCDAQAAQHRDRDRGEEGRHRTCTSIGPNRSRPRAGSPNARASSGPATIG